MMLPLIIIILPIKFNAPHVCSRVPLPTYIRLLASIRILLPDILASPLTKCDGRAFVVVIRKLRDHVDALIVL
jgi:hypothetical protein